MGKAKRAIWRWTISITMDSKERSKLVTYISNKSGPFSVRVCENQHINISTARNMGRAFENFI